MKAINIKWDVDSQEDLDYLPTVIEIPDGMTDEEEISDYISDFTGFCHKGFELIDEQEPQTKKMKKFKIPVTWEVWDQIEVCAETIEEAIQYVRDNIDTIPLGTEPEYIDGSYKIDDGDNGYASIEETVEYLKLYWNIDGDIDGNPVEKNRIDSQTNLEYQSNEIKLTDEQDMSGLNPKENPKKAKKIRVAINGFGRTGRLAFKQLYISEDYEIVAINDLTNPKMLVNLLQYDLTSNPNMYNFAQTIEPKDDAIIIDGKEIKVLAISNPSELPWKELDIDVVLECSGVINSNVQLRKHIKAGAKKVVDGISCKVINQDDNVQYPHYINNCVAISTANINTFKNSDKISSQHKCIMLTYDNFQRVIDEATNGLEKVEYEFGAYLVDSEKAEETDVYENRDVNKILSDYFGVNVTSWHSDCNEEYPCIYILYKE